MTADPTHTFGGIGVSAGTAVGPLVLVRPAPQPPADEPPTTDPAAAWARVQAVLEDVAAGLEARAESADAHAKPQAAGPGEAEHKRKRRRRRRGQPVDNGTASEPTSAGSPKAATAPKPGPVIPQYVAPRSVPGAEKPSLLARIGRGLKSLVRRPPNRHH